MLLKAADIAKQKASHLLGGSGHSPQKHCAPWGLIRQHFFVHSTHYHFHRRHHLRQPICK